MKKTTFLLALALLCSVWSKADTSTTIITLGETQQMTLSEIIAYGLPVIYVQTENQEEPTCDIIYVETSICFFSLYSGKKTAIAAAWLQNAILRSPNSPAYYKIRNISRSHHQGAR